MTWILTASGRQFDLLNPTAAMVTPYDIAHALAHLCRFNGHTRQHYSVAQHSLLVANLCPEKHQLAHLCRFNGHTRQHYSVAQHSLLVANLCPEKHQLAALLHDATEAYIGDMVRPLKQVMPQYRQIEESIWQAICDRFNLEPILPECVVRADLVLLATERRDLMPDHPSEWDCLKGTPAMPERITPLTAQAASMQFFSRLMDLMQADHRRRVCA